MDHEKTKMKSDEVKELTEQELRRLIKNNWKKTDEPTKQNSSLSALEALGLTVKPPILSKDVSSLMLKPFKEKNASIYPQHRGFFGRITQLSNTVGDAIGQTLDFLEAAQKEAAKNIYGREDTKGLTREERINLIMKRMEKDN